MRNLNEYPITFDETKDCLQRLLNKEMEKKLIGDLTPSILEHIIKNLDEMWSDGYFDEWPFETVPYRYI